MKLWLFVTMEDPLLRDNSKWRYIINTGPQCKGLISRYKYKSEPLAMAAGERMIKKLEGAE